MRSFTIEISGHRYRGAWLRINADTIEVRSEYGRRTASLQGRDPADVARALLAVMVPSPQPKW